MNVKDAIQKRRTIRKFKQEKIDDNILTQLIDFARLAPSGINLQPLKYAIITDENMLNLIYPQTKWAGYLTDGAPAPNERPTAYIAVLGDLTLKKEFEPDAGAAITNIITGAMEYGLGSCWLGAINRKEILKALGLSDSNYSLLYMIALGYPLQESISEDISDNDVKYHLDNDGKMHVPKRTVEEVLIMKK